MEIYKRHGSGVTDDHSLTTRSKTPERRRDSREGARHDGRDGARDGVKGGTKGDTGDAANANGTTYGQCLKQRPIWCLVPRRNDAGNDAKMANKRLREIAPGTVRETLPDCAKDSARNSLRNSAQMALQTAHESARNGAKMALEMTPEMAPRPTPKRRPNRPRICARNGARRTKRNGARRHAPLQHSMVPRSYESTTLRCQSAIPIRDARSATMAHEATMIHETTAIGQLASC